MYEADRPCDDLRSPSGRFLYKCVIAGRLGNSDRSSSIWWGGLYGWSEYFVYCRQFVSKASKDDGRWIEGTIPGYPEDCPVSATIPADPESYSRPNDSFRNSDGDNNKVLV